VRLRATKKGVKMAEKTPQNRRFPAFFPSFPNLGKIKQKSSGVWKK
jgi:hypothetical protein